MQPAATSATGEQRCWPAAYPGSLGSKSVPAHLFRPEQHQRQGGERHRQQPQAAHCSQHPYIFKGNSENNQISDVGATAVAQGLPQLIQLYIGTDRGNSGGNSISATGAAVIAYGLKRLAKLGISTLSVT